jgi:hypothetical protein
MGWTLSLCKKERKKVEAFAMAILLSNQEFMLLASEQQHT